MPMPKPDKATVGSFGMGKDLPGRSLPMPVAFTTRERGGGGAPAGQPPPAPPSLLPGPRHVCKRDVGEMQHAQQWRLGVRPPRLMLQ